MNIRSENRDPFRSLILEQVDAILEKEPGRDTLCELLRVVSPRLQEADIEVEGNRSKIYKTLKLRVHPDKHSNDSMATNIFQNLDSFFVQCEEVLRKEKASSRKKKRRRSRDELSTLSPMNFDVRDKWPFLCLSLTECVADYLPKQVSYQCMNTRGAIAHGRKNTLTYRIEEGDSIQSVEEVFDDHGGSKKLQEIYDIKLELMTNGPVVSASFLLTEAFLNNCEKPHYFDKDLVDDTHPLLITGWLMTSYGEVWLAQPLTPRKCSVVETQRIAIGQFGIDDCCLAPLNTFENEPWQSGPYFDIDLSSNSSWYTEWTGVSAYISSCELEKLGEVLAEDFLVAKKEQTKFVIRDRTKIAHSRSCFLIKLKWRSGEKPWFIEVKFI